MTGIFPSDLWAHLERISTLADDDLEARRRKVTLVMMSGICFVASIIWGTLYLALLGPKLTVLITFGFTLVVGLALAVFFASKQFHLLLYPFFFMILWNPIAMQWSLGGFAASGVLMSWSFLAPVCALMFQSLRHAVWWLAAFLALLTVSLLFDAEVSSWAEPLPGPIPALFFGMNLVGPSVAIFLSMAYFVEAFRREHDRSERLLLNILPKSISERLKQSKDDVIADRFSEVTVLFADIAGFTPLAAGIAPEEVVSLLNRVFSAFDRLTERHGLEKIKTIGDAYMVVGGLPEPHPRHAEAVAALAIDMQAEVSRLRAELGMPIRIRIGIDTGPVVAGVIGTRKFAYDLWGDVVNTASRMESRGVEDRIQLTEQAFEKVRHAYLCEPRGEIEIKGKGTMTTYFLIGPVAHGADERNSRLRLETRAALPDTTGFQG